MNKLIEEIKDHEYWEYEGTTFQMDDGWRYECIERYGGYEGGGEEHWIVFKVSKDGTEKFYKIDGYYSSYDGAYLDGTPYEVVPAEKVITVWESK